MSMIKTENLCKNFGDTKVLKNCSLTIEKGEVVCLIGPSNWYRYSLPITFSIPIIIGITSYTLKKTKASN